MMKTYRIEKQINVGWTPAEYKPLGGGEGLTARQVLRYLRGIATNDAGMYGVPVRVVCEQTGTPARCPEPLGWQMYFRGVMR